MQYIIIGDTDKFTDCLIYVCGESLVEAEKILFRMRCNPNSIDKYFLQNHKNLRIRPVERADCWWDRERD